MGEEHGEKEGREGERQNSPRPCLPAFRPGHFARTAAGQRTFPSGSRLMRFSEAGARGMWLSTIDTGPRRQMRWMNVQA